MREELAQWDYVIAAYLFGFALIAALVVSSWRAMKHAEQKREETKRR